MESRGIFRVALSGGGTPRGLFRLLSLQEFSSLPWEWTEIYWADERYVPCGHAESNFGAAQADLLSRVPVLPAHIHPIPTGSSHPARDASAYEDTLRAAFPGRAWPLMDLCLLGVGQDGHTASLFPGAAALSERSRWVAAARSPQGIGDRITLTIPALNGSRIKLLLACGAAKAAILKTVLGPRRGAPLPAQLLWHGEGRAVLITDRAAAAQL